jgi:hypothetical protein
MGILNVKLQAIDDAQTTLRDRAMQLRQIQRAAARLGLPLADELDDIADDIVEEINCIAKAVSVIISEFMSEAKKEPVDAVAIAGQSD